MKKLSAYTFVFLCLFAMSGCTERDRQKGFFGDPALATDADAKEIKKEIAALRAEMNKRFDQIEKQNKNQ